MENVEIPLAKPSDFMLGHPILAGGVLTAIAAHSDPTVQCEVVKGWLNSLSEQAEFLREQTEGQLTWSDGSSINSPPGYDTISAQENFLSSLLMDLEEGKATTGTAQVIEGYIEQLSLDEVRFPENRAPTTERARDNIESDKVALISLKLASEGRYIRKCLGRGALKQRHLQKIAEDIFDGEKVFALCIKAVANEAAARYLQASTGKKVAPWTPQGRELRKVLRADRYKGISPDAILREYEGLVDSEQIPKTATELLQKRRTHRLALAGIGLISAVGIAPVVSGDSNKPEMGRIESASPTSEKITAESQPALRAVGTEAPTTLPIAPETTLPVTAQTTLPPATSTTEAVPVATTTAPTTEPSPVEEMTYKWAAIRVREGEDIEGVYARLEDITGEVHTAATVRSTNGTFDGKQVHAGQDLAVRDCVEEAVLVYEHDTPSRISDANNISIAMFKDLNGSGGVELGNCVWVKERKG